MEQYDIRNAFEKIEIELIRSMKRNMKKHWQREDAEKIQYAQWQAEQLASLQKFKKKNATKFVPEFKKINEELNEALQMMFRSGKNAQEIAIISAMKTNKESIQNEAIVGNFFQINEKKLNALVVTTTDDMIKAESSILRFVDDIYRQTIYNAQVYLNTGAGTLWQAVDMATHDFLEKGITNIKYKNGAIVNISSYAEMAMRTANKRAYNLGEGETRAEWGIDKVKISQYGLCSQRCLPWQGKVYIDDVWSNGKPDGKTPLLSEAINGGLFHPNCRHTMTSYIEDITPEAKKMTKEEEEETIKKSKLEQQQRYNERQIRKYRRLEEGSTDAENIKKYAEKRKQWQKINKALIDNNSDILKRQYKREI